MNAIADMLQHLPCLQTFLFETWWADFEPITAALAGLPNLETLELGNGLTRILQPRVLSATLTPFCNLRRLVVKYSHAIDLPALLESTSSHS